MLNKAMAVVVMVGALYVAGDAAYRQIGSERSCCSSRVQPVSDCCAPTTDCCSITRSACCLSESTPSCTDAVGGALAHSASQMKTAKDQSENR